MTNIPKVPGNVLRRNPEQECGQPVGQMHINVHGLPGFQTVSFYCNQPRLHTDACRFVGRELTVIRNRDQVFRA